MESNSGSWELNCGDLRATVLSNSSYATTSGWFEPELENRAQTEKNVIK